MNQKAEKTGANNLSWREICKEWGVTNYLRNQTIQTWNITVITFCKYCLVHIKLRLAVLMTISKDFQEPYKVVNDYNYKRKNRMTSQGTGVLGVCKRQPCSASLLLLAERFFVFFFKSTKRNKTKAKTYMVSFSCLWTLPW